MGSSLFVALFVCVVALPLTMSTYRCLRLEGRVLCPGDPSKVSNVLVTLREHDGPENEEICPQNDVVMGMAVTDEEGVYRVSGCAYDEDIGEEVNEIEPYLIIEHNCIKGRSSRFLTFLKELTFEDRVEHIRDLTLI